MIFTRLMTPSTMRRWTWAVSISTPSTRKRTRSSLPLGSRWMSDACCSTAWAMIWLTRRMTGASSAVAQVHDLCWKLLGLLLLGGDDVVQARQARDQVGDVLAAGHRRADLLARQQRDVVDGEHVGRIDHRHEQGAVVQIADRDRLVALGGGDRDQVGGLHVRCEARQVEVLEAVALGDGARMAFGAEDALLQQDVLGRLAGAPRLLDRRGDALTIDEPEIDDDVGQKACRPPARRGGVMPFGLGSFETALRGIGSGNIDLCSGTTHRGAHKCQRRRLARPDGEAQRALGDQDLESVDDLQHSPLRLCD